VTRRPAVGRRLLGVAVLLLFIFVLASVLGGCLNASDAPVPTAPSSTTAPTGPTTTIAPGFGDEVFAQAFADRADGLEVEGKGTVQKLLSDDVNGERHQRFIVELASGQTLLIAHNIDVAARVPGLQVGDTVAFKGEYVWNAQGGLVHWTHRDPAGGHVAGWIRYKGTTYQ
jgi:hypothetical protein